MAEGVRDIDDVDLCTSCRKDLFFSARRDGQTRQADNVRADKGIGNGAPRRQRG